MNVEELKKEFAKHLQVKELDTREGYAVEWTVAAMKSKEGKISEWQLCPKCNGDGNLMRYNSPSMSTTACPICDVCNGSKIIAKPVFTQPDKSNEAIEGIAKKYYNDHWKSDQPPFVPEEPVIEAFCAGAELYKLFNEAGERK